MTALDLGASPDGTHAALVGLAHALPALARHALAELAAALATGAVRGACWLADMVLAAGEWLLDLVEEGRAAELGEVRA